MNPAELCKARLDCGKAEELYNKPRYKIMPTSQSAHCCFTHTVVDTTKPQDYVDAEYGRHYDAVCECFSQEAAELICDALNKTQKETAHDEERK